jgi:hypothetical protein
MNVVLAKQIIEMARVDQLARKKAGRGMKQDIGNLLVYAIDGANNQYIKNIIADYGYPKKKTIGESGMHAFWLLVQHQDFDLKLQEACFKKCDFDKKDKAHLADRMCKAKGLPQIYGTQYERKNGKIVLWEVKDKKNLIKRRKEVGLG